MAGKKYLKNVNAVPVEQAATQVSAGAANANDIVALGPDGYLDVSMFPASIGSDSYTLPATEALLAGDFVNVYDSGSGTFSCRKADASSAREAFGYVTAAVASGAIATIMTDDKNTSQTGLTPGPVYLSATTAGRATNTCPTATGQIAQRLGVAYLATAVHVSIQLPILIG